MDACFRPAFWRDSFRFTPLPPDDAPLPEEAAVEVADRTYYVQRWPDVRIVAQYGRYDDGGRGTTLITPADLPDPPYPTGGWEGLRGAERQSWMLRRLEWHKEAERRSESISHRDRLVWLIAFIGIDVEPYTPTKAVRVKVVDVVTQRVIAGYEQADASHL